MRRGCVVSVFSVVLPFFCLLRIESISITLSDPPSIGLRSLPLPKAHNGGILTVQSGCRMSRWIFKGRECKWSSPQPRISQLLQNSSQLEEYDTIYVPFTEVERFVDDFLDGVSTNIVVISGDWQNVKPISNRAIHELLNHTHVIKWFCQNLPKYGGTNPYHPKIAPFPYGLKEGGKETLNPLPSYKQILFESIHNTSHLNKTKFIFAGPLGHGDGERYRLPRSSKRMNPIDYFLEMAKSKYVLSPNGDRPECNRHYEAIGLGTVPITELDPILYRHLENGPVIFDNKEWNLTLLEKELDPRPVVKRSMILEDYWMDWVDDVIGFRIKWSAYENGNGLTEFENGLLESLA